jgi:hypothetical protein
MSTDSRAPRGRSQRSRGGALLATLWLTAGLTAIAFSVAVTVRGEIRRTANHMESVQAHFLATGALERALTYMLWGPGQTLPNGLVQYWKPGVPLLRFISPGGESAVEIVPESSRLNVNTATPDQLALLLAAMGLEPPAVAALTSAILDWRVPPPGPSSPFDRIYLQAAPSFRAPHASLEQIEELLSVQGVTPDLFYGRYQRLPDGQLVQLPGLRDCLSVYSGGTSFDLNTVAVPVMISIGVPPNVARSIDALRRISPILEPQLPAINDMLGPLAGRFRLGGDRIYTLIATARPRNASGAVSDLRRSASMTVQLMSRFTPDGYRVLHFREAQPESPRFLVWPN